MAVDRFAAERSAMRHMFATAVAAVSARHAMPATLPATLFATARGRRVVIALGKAAAEMMQVASERIDGPFEGLLITRAGHLIADKPPVAGVTVILAGHPVPDAASVRGGQAALSLAAGMGEGDQLLLLLSGGGSALMALPAPGVSLADKQAVTRALLHCGASIAEINTVRCHLSAVKGGRLAAAASPAQVTTLIISDVPGDDPSFVASGPSVVHNTTLAMARDILARYGIAHAPGIAAALGDEANETPKGLGGPTGEIHIIACARDALAAAAAVAAKMGYAICDLGDDLEGEARDVARGAAELALGFAAKGGRHAILSGGETTVTVRNPQGRGGRNLEYALSMAIALGGAPGICAMACDTDGIDGSEDAAGAIVTPDTLARAQAAGLDAQSYLARNDAYTFFERLGDLVITGPTRTNVNDFRLILVG